MHGLPSSSIPWPRARLELDESQAVVQGSSQQNPCSHRELETLGRALRSLRAESSARATCQIRPVHESEPAANVSQLRLVSPEPSHPQADVEYKQKDCVRYICCSDRISKEGDCKLRAQLTSLGLEIAEGAQRALVAKGLFADKILIHRSSCVLGSLLLLLCLAQSLHGSAERVS